VKIQIESTSKTVQLNGVPARVWEGTTDSGIPVVCFVTRIAVPEGRPPADYEQFERELQAHNPPSREVDAIPLRLIL
jgi:hypothetical protein